MNERIRELRASAFAYATVSSTDYFEDKKDFNEKFDEKFAELIIEECEKVILAKLAVTDIDGEAERAWEMGMECGVYTIKEHFGVQE